MAAVADLLNAAGPYAGWVCFALLTVAGLWAYATDRLVSIGRHREQADHYEQRLAQERQHLLEQIGDLEQRADAHLNDKAYWRDHALELMAVAAKVGRT